MGDFDYGQLGGGIKGSASVLEGLRLGKKDQEDVAQAKFDNEIKKQQTFNQVAQVAIQSAQLKKDLLKLDPDFDTSVIDATRMQISSPQYGADELNAQVGAPGQPSPISLLPQYNPSGVDMSGFKPMSEREEILLRQRAGSPQSDATERQLRLFRLRDVANNLDQAERSIRQAVSQSGAQEFASVNTWGTPRTYEKLRGTKNEYISGLMEEYKAQLYNAFEDSDPEIVRAAKNKNPGLYKQWQKEKEYESSPEKKIEDYQQAPQDGGGDEVVEPAPTPEKSARLKKVKDLAVAYLGGAKIPEIKTDGYSEQALQDTLMGFAKKGLITPSDVSDIIKHVRSVEKSTKKEAADRRLFDDQNTMLSKEERDARWALRQKGSPQARR